MGNDEIDPRKRVRKMRKSQHFEMRERLEISPGVKIGIKSTQPLGKEFLLGITLG